MSRSFFGQSVVIATCPSCNGEGSIVRTPCSDCKGEGRRRESTTLTVKIPAGVSTGNYIPLRGQGESGQRGGSAGDCLVFIEEEEHEYFTRDGNDVLYLLPISFGQAVLGDEVEVPTLTGKALMKIPAGVQSGKTLRLRQKGIPDVNGRGIGDQLVQIVVWTPTSLSPRERELFEELARLEKDRAASEGKGFFEKMRQAFSD